MSQTTERSRRNPWVRIAAAAAVCLALVLAFPAWTLAASSHEITPPAKPGVSDAPSYGYPDTTIPDDKQPHTDFYIMVPTLLPGHEHDTDTGKQVMLTVIVTDKITRKPLAGVRVEIQDPDRLGVPSITGSREELHMTDSSGTLQIALFPDPKKRYQISINHLGYQPYTGRPFTVEASQEMRIELVPTVAVLSPPAIVTEPGIRPPSVPAVTSPQKGDKPTKGGKGGKHGEQAMTEEGEASTQSAIENETQEEPYQPALDHMGGSGQGSQASTHWFILVSAALTGLLGGWRLWRIHRHVTELELQNEGKQR